MSICKINVSRSMDGNFKFIIKKKLKKETLISLKPFSVIHEAISSTSPTFSYEFQFIFEIIAAIIFAFCFRTPQKIIFNPGISIYL